MSSYVPANMANAISPYRVGLGDNPLIDSVSRTACPDVTTPSPIDVSYKTPSPRRYLPMGTGNVNSYMSYTGQNWTSNPSGLGVSIATIAQSAIGGATTGSAAGPVGTVVGTIVSIAASVLGSLGGSAKASDPLEKITDKIPASAVNAYVGQDGWWYDNTDNHQLTHKEASQRQHQVGANAIGASVGPDGWWYDNADNHQLSHAEAWQRYQTLVASGGNYGGSPDTGGINVSGGVVTWKPAITPGESRIPAPKPGGIAPRAPVPQAAGIPGGTMGLIVLVAIIGAVLMSQKKTR